MKKYILYSLILLLLYVNKLKAQNEKANCLKFNELYENQNGLFYEINSAQLFSGIVIETINNDTIRKICFIEGKANGYDSSFYGNKKLKSYYHNKNGLYNGKFYELYENGNIYEKGYYRKGNHSGMFRQFYKDGKIKVKGRYFNGNKIGKWYYFNTDASIGLIERYNIKGALKK